MFTSLNMKEGLIYSAVRTIVEDKARNLWFGSRGGGLWRYDGKSLPGGQAIISDFSEKVAVDR